MANQGVDEEVGFFRISLYQSCLQRALETVRLRPRFGLIVGTASIGPCAPTVSLPSSFDEIETTECLE